MKFCKSAKKSDLGDKEFKLKERDGRKQFESINLKVNNNNIVIKILDF